MSAFSTPVADVLESVCSFWGLPYPTLNRVTKKTAHTSLRPIMSATLPLETEVRTDLLDVARHVGVVCDVVHKLFPQEGVTVF